MRKFYISISLLLFALGLKAQCLNDRNAFESYFEQNIKTLDQIEGIWSMNVYVKLYTDNEIIDSKYFSQNNEYVIIRDGLNFKVCEIYKSIDADWKVEFSPTANPNIYLYKKTDLDEITKANAVMTSVGLLEYSYETGRRELKKTFGTQYKEGLREFKEYEWIKTYPILETFQNKQKSSGTGFAISVNGLIVTCNHVIDNANKIEVRGINNDFTKTFKAKTISADKNNDLAIIQIDDPSFTTIENIPYILADKSIEVGSSVFALGYPLRSTMGDEIKLTDGIISAKSGYKGDITAYQISVPVQPGNSGGPLFDDKGNIVGIINAKNILAENAAYAVKVSYLRNLLESLSLNLNLTTANTLSTMSLPEKVKIVKNFTYIIEVN